MSKNETTPQTIRVLTLQPSLRWLQPMPNLHHLRQTVEKSLEKHPADLVVLPEVFNGMPADRDPQAASQARRFLATLARACRVNVIGGSIDHTCDDGKLRNICFALNDQGKEVGSYHKRILFAHERSTRTPGDHPGIVQLAGIRIGVLICGDLWEPALARELVDRVDLLCVVAKTTVASQGNIDYARRLWWNLALTRAMENALPVVVSDWAEDRHEATSRIKDTKVREVHHTSGGSSIVDPGQRPHFKNLQKTIINGRPGILTATIDLHATAEFRTYRQNVGLLPSIPNPNNHDQ